MPSLILSDLHGNLDALLAVLSNAAGQYGDILCCGDVVGYGAAPAEVVDWTREHARVCIRGNHDRACCGLDSADWFNPVARQAAQWTRAALDDERRAWLAALPAGPLLFDGFEIAHGSPLDEDDYLVTRADIDGLDRTLERAICFFGHTHLQGGWVFQRGGPRPLPVPRGEESETVIALDPDSLYLINPGSVGQPRDKDPRAGYALWDPAARTIAFRRVAYDVEAAQRRILQAGLSHFLAERLAYGA